MKPNCLSIPTARRAAHRREAEREVEQTMALALVLLLGCRASKWG